MFGIAVEEAKLDPTWIRFSTRVYMTKDFAAKMLLQCR